MADELKKPNYAVYDGFRMPAAFSIDAFRSAVRYKPKPGELFIATYPKCGTTWLQFIALHILRKGKPIVDEYDFMSHSPFIEFAGADAIDMIPGPGVIKTHLSFDLVPYSPDAKYIYVARNPKDCCVSFYHHTVLLPLYNYRDGTFDEYFELFVNGQTDFGDYFDHHLSWYEHKDDSNIHFITYEQLKADTKGEVLKIAKFIGDEYYNCLKTDPKVLDNVVEYSSLNYMKSILNSGMENLFSKCEVDTSDIPLPSGIQSYYEYMKKHPTLPSSFSEGGQFVRKGIIGDWKNHFSQEQERKMQERIKEKTAGSNLMSLWK